MRTTGRLASVSFAAAMSLTFGLSACAHAPSRMADNAPLQIDSRRQVIRFDNLGREHVHVYLIGDKRQWLLGRVEPGAKAMLRIPAESLDEGSAFVQLAVVPGQAATLQASRAVRMKGAIAQPASALLSQRWTFLQGTLTSEAR